MGSMEVSNDSHGKAQKRKRRAPEDERKTNCPKKYKKWSEESMRGAVKCVMNGRMGVNRAAGEHVCTLKAGGVVHGTPSGPQPYLTPEEVTASSLQLQLAIVIFTLRFISSQFLSCTIEKLMWSPFFLCMQLHAVWVHGKP